MKETMMISPRNFLPLPDDATDAERAAVRAADAAEEVATRASDAADAVALQIKWAGYLASQDHTRPKMVHTERLCREAVSSGMLRYRIGYNPTTIVVK